MIAQDATEHTLALAVKMIQRNWGWNQFAYLSTAALDSLCKAGGIIVWEHSTLQLHPWCYVSNNYLRNPSKLRSPFCALNLFGSYSWMRSLARAGFAYGWRISFSLGSRCVLFRKSTNCVFDMIRRFDVPTLREMKIWWWWLWWWRWWWWRWTEIEDKKRRENGNEIFICTCRFESFDENVFWSGTTWWRTTQGTSQQSATLILTYISSKSFSTSVLTVRFLYKLKKSSNWSFCTGMASVLPIGSPDTSSAFSTRRLSSLCDAKSFIMLRKEKALVTCQFRAQNQAKAWRWW